MADGVFDEGLTTDEKAYFESRGEDSAESPAAGEAAPPESPTETALDSASPPDSTEPALDSTEPAPEGDEKSDSVPLWALKEARDRVRAAQAERKQLEEQLSSEREARVRLEERFSVIERANQPPPPEAAPMPDQEMDPLGYEQVRREALEREVDNLKRVVADTKLEGEIGWINTHTAQLTQQFAGKVPDYEEALTYVKERRREQIKLLYPTASDANVEEQVAVEYGNIVRESLERLPNGAIRFRRVPAEAVYQMAKSMGFQTKAPPAAIEEATSAADERVELTRRRAAASTSLSSVSGAEGSGPLDAKRLAQMSEAEFGKLLRDKPDLINKLMGA
ncbi:hypothetical protein UFOVP1287_45 [uncultured Caudovirales phage]|uniref:Uncharacterized protein n=1 Tax=uncultured Caudovirales phage TaxID=2100421 RepID=A0A6J5REQ0_9CAUD|nr:hypothetical protein UFOVP1287_45 [uncultured Caudovirales phage]CAB4205333.1 hypothetical protein UFOVP1408_68 [uncultured Caudovirales phage]